MAAALPHIFRNMRFKGPIRQRPVGACEFCQTLRVFEYCLKYIQQIFGDDYFPCSKSGQTTCLSHLGVRGARGGLRMRPRLVYLEKVLQLVTSATPLNTLKVFSIDSVELPVQKPLFEIPVPFSDKERKHNPHISDSGL